MRTNKMWTMMADILQMPCLYPTLFIKLPEEHFVEQYFIFAQSEGYSFH